MFEKKIEFRDTNGILRSWKSIYDGGYAEFTSIQKGEQKWNLELQS